MKINITVSLCISNNFTVNVGEVTSENLYNAFMVQYGFLLGVSDYSEHGKWIVDDIEIINNDGDN